MEDKDNIAKNIQQVKNQFVVWQVEMEMVTEKIKAAYHNEKGFYRIRRMFHHSTGYLEESIDQLPKFWFYTWLPKYTFIGYFFVKGVQAVFF
jgi:hypothetical protein